MFGIYTHIPFCRKACFYCDFHFSTGLKAKPLLVDGICQEIRLTEDFSGETPRTVYFGGGTPSLLERDELSQIIEELHRKYDLSDVLEYTLEANPDDLNRSKLTELQEAGINRLSIGIQSFNDDVLQSANRSHNAEQAQKCIDLARNAGFSNISVDLIYGLPGSGWEILKSDLQQLSVLQPEHVSVYCFTIEEKTVFGHQHKKGTLKAASEEDESDQFEYIMDFLIDQGYRQYEISNFGKPGYYSQHNSSYWENIPYLGLGPSAHGFDGKNRWHNIASNPRYIHSLHEGKLPRIVEPYNKINRMNERILTALRTEKGLNLKEIEDDYHIQLINIHATAFQSFTSEDLLQVSGQQVILTRKGKLLADAIASELFVDGD